MAAIGTQPNDCNSLADNGRILGRANVSPESPGGDQQIRHLWVVGLGSVWDTGLGLARLDLGSIEHR